MNKAFNKIKTVAVIFGGASHEYEISCVSAAFVTDCIDKNKYNVVKIGVTQKGIWYIYNGSTHCMRNLCWCNDIDNLVPAVISPCTVQHGLFAFDKQNSKFDTVYIDVAFPLIHGNCGEDGTLQGLLTLAKIPYVGSKTFSSAVCMDKDAAKRLCGVNTVPWLCTELNGSFDMEAFVASVEEKFSYPVFVKPANSGSSFGASKANDRAQLETAMRAAFRCDPKILVEKYMYAKEIEVAILGDECETVSVCGEIDAGGVYDFETKYVNGNAKSYIPARLEDDTAQCVRENAVKAYKALGCRSFARVDFFVDGNDVYFNEINTIPGFTPTSMYPKLMENAGMPPRELASRLIETAK